MVKTAALSFRINDDVKAALDAAAHDDGRSVSAFVERALTALMIERGYLEKPKSKPRK